MDSFAISKNLLKQKVPVFEEMIVSWVKNIPKDSPPISDEEIQDVEATASVIINPELLVTKATRNRIKSLSGKIAALPPEKVLDVSNLKENGTGIVTRDKPTYRSKKFGFPGLPIVSSDLDHYILAIEMLPGGKEKYSEEIGYVSKLFIIPNIQSLQIS